jgi:hypothetical protein
LPFDSAWPRAGREPSPPDFAIAGAAVRSFDASHPRLLFDRGAVSGLRERAAACSRLQARFECALRSTDGTADPRSRIKHDARRLVTIVFMALVGEDPSRAQALAAARVMLRDFAGAVSWSPRPVIKSFLDRAETAVAVALAYDWLYDALSPVERDAVEQAIARQVFAPALAAYAGGGALWTRRRTSNCTIVSNAAILIAALAVAPRWHDTAATLVQHSLASAWNAFAGFAPDGAWPEGLSYWSLAVRYAALMVAALESAVGDSFGLAARPGFSGTGDFALHAAGPFGAAFDFGDSLRNFDRSPLAWLAHRYRRPQDGWQVRDYDGAHLPFALIWSQRPAADPQQLSLPTGKIFRNCDLACFRNTWSSAPTARPIYFAIKGGAASLEPAACAAHPEHLMLHGQADAGSFILDGARRRWVADPGPDDYDLPGYFDHGLGSRAGGRWRYWRNQAAGHNTLTIDGRDQIPNAKAPVIDGEAEGDRKWVVFDLSAAYGEKAGTIRRGAALTGRRVVIQDEIGPDVAGRVVWAMHTSADPESVTRSVARFRCGEDRLVVRILTPRHARLRLVRPPAPQSFPVADPERVHGSCPAGGEISELPRCDDLGPLRRLEIVWPKGTRRLVVALLPDCEDEEVLPPVAPLDEWLGRRTPTFIEAD